MLRSFQRITDFLEPADDRRTRRRTGDVRLDILDDEERSDVGGWYISSTKGEDVFEQIHWSTGRSSGTIRSEGVIARIRTGDSLELSCSIPEEDSHSTGRWKIDEEFDRNMVAD